jgi:phosphoribosylanthranilate isomerase
MTVQVKICGITNVPDALCAIDAGADLLGFIFVAASPRHVTHDQVRTIVDELARMRSSLPKLVGVFVDEDPVRIGEILQIARLDYAQLHGSEPVSDLEALPGRAFKAVRPGAVEESKLISDAKRFALHGIQSGPRLLVDAYSPHAHGGTGELSDWKIAATLAADVPGFVLAGGLTPDNVASAVRSVRPWAVDTSSGVEAEHGRKDHEAVKRFILAAKSPGK